MSIFLRRLEDRPVKKMTPTLSRTAEAPKRLRISDIALLPIRFRSLVHKLFKLVDPGFV